MADTAIATAPELAPLSPAPRAFAPAAAVRLDAVTKVYGTGKASVAALDTLSLDVEKGSFTCIVGASGCGKTTLLNLIASLDQPTSGRVEVTGRSALMFQESALFPWLTAAGNVELALRLQGVGRAARRKRAAELLGLVHLGGFATKRPHELSGGMRQRVALARALAQDADVLLMDEPFGALDAITRDLLHDELEGVWRHTGLTVVFVTHNVREAARLGDRIVLLASRPGRLAADFPVDLPRPRRIEDHGVTTMATRVTEQLRREVARHGHGA
ncbi:MAG TPA: ABC transporter ATP-binding protein [Acidimicrobiales bacterium]|nr:ABC transporter ATP-binding protein [Acidimicrobiales bacterium]